MLSQHPSNRYVGQTNIQQAANQTSDHQTHIQRAAIQASGSQTNFQLLNAIEREINLLKLRSKQPSDSELHATTSAQPLDNFHAPKKTKRPAPTIPLPDVISQDSRSRAHPRSEPSPRQNHSRANPQQRTATKNGASQQQQQPDNQHVIYTIGTYSKSISNNPNPFGAAADIDLEIMSSREDKYGTGYHPPQFFLGSSSVGSTVASRDDNFQLRGKNGRVVGSTSEPIFLTSKDSVRILPSDVRKNRLWFRTNFMNDEPVAEHRHAEHRHAEQWQAEQRQSIPAAYRWNQRVERPIPRMNYKRSYKHKTSAFARGCLTNLQLCCRKKSAVVTWWIAAIVVSIFILGFIIGVLIGYFGHPKA